MGPIACPLMSGRNCHYWLHNYQRSVVLISWDTFTCFKTPYPLFRVGYLFMRSLEGIDLWITTWGTANITERFTPWMIKWIRSTRHLDLLSDLVCQFVSLVVCGAQSTTKAGETSSVVFCMQQAYLLLAATGLLCPWLCHTNWRRELMCGGPCFRQKLWRKLKYTFYDQ